MDTPLRELVVVALCTRLENITTSNGYPFSVIEVKRDVWEPVSGEALPVVVVNELDESLEIDGDAVGTYVCTLPLAITIAVDASETPATTKNLMLASLTKALGYQFDVVDADNHGQICEVVELSNTNSEGLDGSLLWVELLVEVSYARSLSDPARVWVDA